MKVVMKEDGSIDIICHNQKVLTIDETSDVDTINLFLIPVDGSILTTDDWSEQIGMEKEKKPWTHELLADRKKEHKQFFLDNEPVYILPEKEWR